MRCFIGNTGGLAALAFGFGIFLNVLSHGALSAFLTRLPLGVTTLEVSGIQGAAVAALWMACALNCMAVSASGHLASVLAVVKAAFIIGIAALAVSFGGGDWSHLTMAVGGATCEGVPEAARGGVAGAGAAMIAAMWAYNGWNELTYVAGEVRDPGRTLPRALAVGLCVIAALYVSVNASYFHVLTPAEVASVPLGSTVATDVVTRVLGPRVAGLLAAAFAVSVFSALVMATLLAARVPFAMAEDGLFFKALAKLSPNTRVPIRALVAQTVWATLLVLSGSFDTLTDYAMFSILLFVGMATASVFVLRRKWPDVDRPYRTWGYPVVPLLAIAVTVWLLMNTLMTAPSQAMAGLALLAAGLPFYWYWSKACAERRSAGLQACPRRPPPHDAAQAFRPAALAVPAPSQSHFNVFQLRVVDGTPKTRSGVSRYRSTFMFRRYMADHQPAVALQQLHHPDPGRRRCQRQRWRGTRRLRQDADEADDVGPRWLAHEVVAREEPQDISAVADRHVRGKGEPPGELGAQPRLGDRRPDHEGPCRTDVDHIEVRQIAGQQRGLERPVSADVDAPEQNDQRHA